MISRLAFTAVAIALLASQSGAAQTTDSEGAERVRQGGWPTTSAPVSFVDDRPFSVSLDRLRADEGISVLLHNNRGRPQSLALRAVGFERATEEGVVRLLSVQPAEKEVGPGETSWFRLPPGDPADIPTGSYEGLLVATGESGPPARRQLTIKVADKAEPVGRGTALSPNDISAVTVGATNYLPSLLAPWSAAVLAAGLLGLFGLWAVWPAMSARPDKPAGLTRWRIAIAAGCVFGVILGSLFLFRADLTEPGSISAISTSPLPVTGVADGVVGVAQNEQGELVRLEVQGAQLVAEDLEAAGVFKGTIDLTPSAEGGSADVTINVRDWWPLAFLALAIGLGLAYWLRRWFQSKRAVMLLDLRSDAIERTLTDARDLLSQEMKGRFARFTIQRRVATRLGEFQRQRDEGEFDKAGGSLDELRDYIWAFVQLSERLVDAKTRVDQIAADHERESFGVPKTAISVKTQFERLEEQTLDGDHPDPEEEALKGYSGKLTPVRELAGSVREGQDMVLSLLDIAESCVEDEQGRADLIRALRSLGAGILRTPNQEAMTELEKALADLYVRTEELCSDPPRSQLDQPDVRAPFREALHFLPAITDLAPPAAEPWPDFVREPESKVEIGWRRVGFDSDPSHRPDDAVAVEITFPPEDLDYREVKIDLGDERPAVTRCVPDGEPRRIELFTSYPAAGSYAISVETTDGSTLGKKTVAVTGRSRQAELKDIFWRTDRMMVRVAFLVAVATGLSVLYFTDPGWGEPQDYLTAVIWGGAASEATMWTATLAKRFTG